MRILESSWEGKILFEKTPKVILSFSVLAHIYFSTTKVSADQLQAESYVESGEIDLAIAAYQRIHPVTTSILTRMGHLYGDKKADYDSALKCYTAALKIEEEVS